MCEESNHNIDIEGEKRREYYRNYYHTKQKTSTTYKQKRKKYMCEYMRKNKDKVSAVRSLPENRAKINARTRKWRKNTEKGFFSKFTNNLRKAIYKAVRKKRVTKIDRTINLLGCSANQFKEYIESLWHPNMNWENYGIWRSGGPMTWHIDHIIPVSSFDLSDPEQQRKCFHYSNLQPLWAIDNMIKGNKIAHTN